MNPLAKKLSPKEYRKTSITLKREYEAKHGHREFMHNGLKNSCELCNKQTSIKPNKVKIKRSERLYKSTGTIGLPSLF